ncbi:MAG: hypothetical protein AAF423_09805 [Pseudomonadota bacterium]
MHRISTSVFLVTAICVMPATSFAAAGCGDGAHNAKKTTVKFLKHKKHNRFVKLLCTSSGCNTKVIHGDGTLIARERVGPAGEKNVRLHLKKLKQQGYRVTLASLMPSS